MTGLSNRSKAYVRTCHHCGEEFETGQPFAAFCSREHKEAAHNLEKARGQQLYRLAYGWATGSGASFSDLSWLARQFVKEDREAGRPPPPKATGRPSTAHNYLTNKDARRRKAKLVAASLDDLGTVAARMEDTT